MPTNLGLVHVKGVYKRYLQAHKDNGEMHCSQKPEDLGTEETWFLIEVDKAAHIYALQNWSNGNFMSKKTPTGCVPADSAILGRSEQWVLTNGTSYGAANAVAFRSCADDTLLGTNQPKQDDGPCRGEVSARATYDLPQNNAAWPGWWVLEPCGPPAASDSVWNTLGGVFAGIAVQLAAAAIPVVLASL